MTPPAKARGVKAMPHRGMELIASNLHFVLAFGIGLCLALCYLIP